MVVDDVYVVVAACSHGTDTQSSSWCHWLQLVGNCDNNVLLFRQPVGRVDVLRCCCFLL
jgi:hypothetical protein